MQISSRFTIAIHTMLCIAYFSEQRKVTSEFIALSTNSNPVVIRRILGQLKRADLIEIKPGVGGALLKKEVKDISLLDIFYAVEAVQEDFFNFHANPNCQCPLGKNIHTILDSHLYAIQESMYKEMKQISLKKLLKETKQFL